MAINKEDTVDQSLKARLARKVDGSYAGTFLSEMFNITSPHKRQDESFLQIMGYACLGMSLPIYILLNTEMNQTTLPSYDTEATYSAISDDEGRTGYVIFQQSGDYQLYEFNSEGFAGGLSLELVNEHDEAWFLTRGIADNFSNIVDAYSDNDVKLSSRPWEIYSLGDVTIPAITKNDEILRIASEFTEIEPAEGVPLIDHFSMLETQWTQASQSIGQSGSAIEEATASVQAFDTQKINPSDGVIFDEMLALFILSLGGAAMGFGASYSAPRRHKAKNKGMQI